MTEAELIRIENEVFTKIIIDELQKQKKAGTAVGDYVLDRYEIDKKTKEGVRRIMSESR